MNLLTRRFTAIQLILVGGGALLLGRAASRVEPFCAVGFRCSPGRPEGVAVGSAMFAVAKPLIVSGEPSRTVPGHWRTLGASLRTDGAPQPSTPSATDQTWGPPQTCAPFDEGECTLDRGAVTADESLARSARIVPTFRNGSPIGFKVFAIRPCSVYARLGLHNGDVVRRVNGYDLSSPDTALASYERIKSASVIDLELERAGELLHRSCALH